MLLQGSQPAPRRGGGTGRGGETRAAGGAVRGGTRTLTWAPLTTSPAMAEGGVGTVLRRRRRLGAGLGLTPRLAPPLPRGSQLTRAEARPREGAVAEPAPAATCGPSAPGRPRRQVRPYRASPGRAHPRGGRASRLAGNAAPGPSALPWAEAWRHAGTPGGGLVPGPAPGTSSAKGYRVCSDRLDSLPFEALDLLSTSRATH